MVRRKCCKVESIRSNMQPGTQRTCSQEIGRESFPSNRPHDLISAEGSYPIVSPAEVHVSPDLTLDRVHRHCRVGNADVVPPIDFFPEQPLCNFIRTETSAQRTTVPSML
jgi:hypothetical protein